VRRSQLRHRVAHPGTVKAGARSLSEPIPLLHWGLTYSCVCATQRARDCDNGWDHFYDHVIKLLSIIIPPCFEVSGVQPPTRPLDGLITVHATCIIYQWVNAVNVASK
jgi:hypothetical protein